MRVCVCAQLRCIKQAATGINITLHSCHKLYANLPTIGAQKQQQQQEQGIKAKPHIIQLLPVKPPSENLLPTRCLLPAWISARKQMVLFNSIALKNTCAHIHSRMSECACVPAPKQLNTILFKWKMTAIFYFIPHRPNLVAEKVWQITLLRFPHHLASHWLALHKQTGGLVISSRLCGFILTLSNGILVYIKPTGTSVFVVMQRATAEKFLWQIIPNGILISLKKAFSVD